MQSTPPDANRNLCSRCVTAPQVARRFCDCTRPVCQDCDATADERPLSWAGVVDERDVYMCGFCDEARDSNRNEAAE